MGARGQSSVELVIILSAVLIILAFIYAISQQHLTESQNQVRVSQARLSVATLATAAREVYAEGSGARRVVTVTIPEGSNAARTGVFNESVINVGLYMGEGTTDVNELLEFRVVEGANFPKQPGRYQLAVTAFEGYVMLGDPSYTLSPGTIALEMLGNDTANRTLTVTNYGNASLTVSLNLTWPHPSISLSLNGSSALTFAVPAGSSVPVNVNFASSNASLGSYTGRIDANASNGENRTTFIVLQIVGVGAQPQPPSTVSYILIDTFSDPGYTTPASTFDPTETVDIYGQNFAANSLVTLTIRNSTGSTVFVSTNTSDSSGRVAFYWNPGIVSPGTYNATLNDSTKLNSTLFNITGCG